MRSREALQARDQPQRGKAGRGGDRELARAVGGAQLVGRRLQPLQHVGRNALERLAAFGQSERARAPLEQPDAEMVLERLDLPAHRRLGDEKLLRRLREAERPGSRLEALEEREGRQVIALWHSYGSFIA